MQHGSASGSSGSGSGGIRAARVAVPQLEDQMGPLRRAYTSGGGGHGTVVAATAATAAVNHPGSPVQPGSARAVAVRQAYTAMVSTAMTTTRASVAAMSAGSTRVNAAGGGMLMSAAIVRVSDSASRQ